MAPIDITSMLGCVRKVVNFLRDLSVTLPVSCCLPIVPYLTTGERYKASQRYFVKIQFDSNFKLVEQKKLIIIQTKTQNDKIFTGKK